MYNAIISYFKKNDWEFSIIKEKMLILMSFSGENGSFQCVVEIDEDENKMLFYSICGTQVPKDKHSMMAELLTRLNYEKFLGNFIMDFEDGEIRFQTSIFKGTNTISEEEIEFAIMSNIMSVDTS